MQWQQGFKRIRLVGTAAVVLGVALLLAVGLTQALGYGPNPGFKLLYDAFWPLGFMLLVVGLLLWLLPWVLAGFLPTSGPEPVRARFER